MQSFRNQQLMLVAVGVAMEQLPFETRGLNPKSYSNIGRCPGFLTSNMFSSFLRGGSPGRKKFSAPLDRVGFGV